MKGSNRLRAARFPLVLAGPSGSGKTTIAAALIRLRQDVVFSVSATTRRPRPGETDGEDYWFVPESRFRELIGSGSMLEHAEVHGHLYGTPRANLESAVGDDAHLLLDIDVQGARHVREAVPGAVTAFVLPPSGARIVERLRGRGSEDESRLRARLGAAEAELRAIDEFDFVLVNDRLEECVVRLAAIISAEERRISRLGRHATDHAAGLIEDIARALD
jgi:guanylate kinase